MSKIKQVLGRAKPSLESAAVESFDETPLVTTPEEAEVQDEIDTALDPVDADIMGLSSLTEQTNQYQAVADVIEESIQEGGLSMEAAAILNIFMSSHDCPVRARISTENFGGIKLYESQVALEDLRSQIQEWWNKFKAFLKEARSRFEHWIENAFNGAGQLKTQAEQLKESITNAQPGSGDIEFKKKGLLTISGQFPNVGSEMSRFAGIADAVLNETLANTYDSADGIAKAIGSYQMGGEDSLNKLIQVIAQNVNNPADAIGSELTEHVDNSVEEALLKGTDGLNVEVRASKPFFGDAQLTAIIVNATPSSNPVETLSNLAKAMKFSGIAIVDQTKENKEWTSKNDSGDDIKCPRANPSDIAHIADGAIAVADAMLKLKSNGSKKATMDRDIDSAGQAISGMNINEQSESGSQVVSSLRSMVSSISSYPSSVTGKLVSFFGTVARTAVEYGKASLVGEKTEESQPSQQPAA